MKGFLQEYGIIMVVVAVVLGMLAFGKTGYAKSIQDAILGSADHIVETGENITKKKTGDLLKIEGREYIVIEEKEKDKVLVMASNRISSRFHYSWGEDSYIRSDGKYSNTYENSYMDNDLEQWYKRLPTKMQEAIQLTEIKQASYRWEKNIGLVKHEVGPNDQIYNTISRHVFCPSVDEFKKLLNFNNRDKVKEFIKNDSEWTRDSAYVKGTNDDAGAASMYLYAYSGGISTCYGQYINSVRPAFVIDLSKIDYTEVGHVDYK